MRAGVIGEADRTIGVTWPLPPEFLEDLRQRVPLSDIVGKRVKLTRKGRRHSGLCPFHSEKTPSFSVVDDQGFYHCFGCGVHGDAISFLRETDGLDFMEAVERLAGMAGMEVPRSAPEDPDRQRQRKAALDILEVDQRTFFQAALLDAMMVRQRCRTISAATRNLDKNGILSNLSAGLCAAQGVCVLPCQPKALAMTICWLPALSGANRIAMGHYMTISETGSCFRLKTGRGKVIAFGARALGDAQPKYLNSGEGPTFSKKAGALWLGAGARGDAA